MSRHGLILYRSLAQAAVFEALRFSIPIRPQGAVLGLLCSSQLPLVAAAIAVPTADSSGDALGRSFLGLGSASACSFFGSRFLFWRASCLLLAKRQAFGELERGL